MGRQLSRLECEYVLSGLAALKPPLEVSVPANPQKLEGAAPSTAISAAVCRPQFYSYDHQTRRFFLDEAFISENKIPRGVQCRFCFLYKTRRVCFSAEISAAENKSFCRAETLFYADVESPFLPSISGKIFFTGDALSGSLSVRVHKDFPLDTANMQERAMSFSKFAESSSNLAVLEGEEAFAAGSASGILFYLDHRGALACFPPAAGAALFPRGGQEGAAGHIEKIRALKDSPQRCIFRLKFSLRKIEAECAAFFRISRGSLLFCKLSFTALEPENIRFLYEMSCGKKYSGGEIPE